MMWTSLVDHLWQSTLCVLIAWLLTLALAENAAKVRYWVWMAASIKFLVPFSALTWIGARFSWTTQSTPAITDVATSLQRAIEPITTPMIIMRETDSTFDAAHWLIAAWCVGSIALLLRWLLVWSRIRMATNAAKAFAVPIGTVQPTAGPVILQASSASDAKPLQIRNSETQATQKIPQGGPYSGARVNMQFEDIDLRAIAKTFEDITGTRIVVHPSINEKATFKAVNTPWDQALAELVASKGLVMRRAGAEIYIDPRA